MFYIRLVYNYVCCSQLYLIFIIGISVNVSKFYNTFKTANYWGLFIYLIQEVPVQFVDYGNEEFVTDVVAITREHLNQLPFQGIPAQLSGCNGVTTV